MRQFVFAAMMIPFFIGSNALVAQQNPASQPDPASGLAKGWIADEFMDPAGLPVKQVDSFINETCRPSGLDGIQILTLQKGHNEVMNFHIYCRQDNSASAHYKVTMLPITDRKFGAAVNPVAGKPNVRLGAFYFGKDGQPDTFLVIEKTR